MEAAKKEIRSLLLSTPHGLTAAELQDDYQSLMYKTCPFRELGFSSPEHLLRAIPDVAREKGRTGVFCAVPDASTAGIASLIKRQRTKPPKRNRLRFAPSVSRYSSTSTKPHVPLAVRRVMKAVTEAYPNGIHFSRVVEAYGRFSPDGSNLSLNKLGFGSVVSFCQAIPDVVWVDGTRPGGGMVFPASMAAGQGKNLGRKQFMAFHCRDRE